jgi:hypothetical protein
VSRNVAAGPGTFNTDEPSECVKGGAYRGVEGSGALYGVAVPVDLAPSSR